EEQEQLDGIASFRAHLDVQQATVLGRVVDSATEIELIGGPFAGKLAQAAQGNLDVACAQFDLIVEVLVLALVPDLDCLALALAGIADANSLGIETARAE